MLATVAALAVILLLGVACIVYHHVALTREAVEALRVQVRQMEAATRANTRTHLMVETAILTAQRAEENAIAAYALVKDTRPTRQA